MLNDTITVTRGSNPDWVFICEENEDYYYRTRKKIYKLFFDINGRPDIWIGLKYGNSWVTIEKEVKATGVKLTKGTFIFDYVKEKVSL